MLSLVPYRAITLMVKNPVIQKPEIDPGRPRCVTARSPKILPLAVPLTPSSILSELCELLNTNEFMIYIRTAV